MLPELPFSLAFRLYDPLRRIFLIFDYSFFIADFYCAEKKLVIEVDGKIHDFQKDYDERRDEILTNMGLKVIRFKNKEVKFTNRVLDRIETFLVENSP